MARGASWSVVCRGGPGRVIYLCPRCGGGGELKRWLGGKFLETQIGNQWRLLICLMGSRWFLSVQTAPAQAGGRNRCGPFPELIGPRCTGNMGRGGAEEVPYSSVSEPSTSWLMRTPRAEKTPRLLCLCGPQGPKFLSGGLMLLLQKFSFEVFVNPKPSHH